MSTHAGNDVEEMPSRHDRGGGGGWGTLVLLAIALIMVLLLYAIVRFPASLGQEGLRAAVLVLGALAIDAGVAVQVRHRWARTFGDAWSVGARVGGMLVLVEIVNLTLEHRVGDPGVSAIRGIGAWSAIFLAFGTAGALAVQSHGGSSPSALGHAMLASAWSGMIAALGAVVAGVVLAVAFTPWMIGILVPTAAAADPASAGAVVVRHTLDAAAQHLLLMPVVAVVFGLIGGGASLLLSTASRTVASALAGGELALVLTGIVALRQVGALPRAARPPFVMGGLSALGVALACAYPVLHAVRHSRRADTP